MGKSHIVIGGLQRSGTSLVRAIVGSHPEVSIYQWDLPLWTKFSDIYGDRPLSQKEKINLVKDVLQHPKARQAEVRFAYDEFADFTAEESKGNDAFRQFYLRFLDRYRKCTNARVVGIKTPENEFYADRIFRKVPDTKFIHVIRNPLDVAVSLKKAQKKWWGGKMNYFTHIKKWQRSSQLAARNRKRYGKRYMVLKYEDLIRKPENTIDQLAQFLELNTHEQMKRMTGHPGWTGHNSSFKDKSRIPGFRTESVNRYRKKLPNRIQAMYAHYLKNQLNQWGYNCNLNTDIALKTKLKFSAANLVHRSIQFLTSAIRRSNLYRPIRKVYLALQGQQDK